MVFEDLAKFPADLQERAGIKNNVRRLGDQIVFKVGKTEFFFDRYGRYLGLSSPHRSALADLVEDIDPAASGVVEVDGDLTDD